MTTVIHVKDTPSGWKQNDQYVYIGRGSKWGNPYALKAAHPEFPWIPMSRNQVCDLYEKVTLPSLLRCIHELQGKILVCFCKPQRCHGDTLAAAADKEN